MGTILLSCRSEGSAWPGSEPTCRSRGAQLLRLTGRALSAFSARLNRDLSSRERFKPGSGETRSQIPTEAGNRTNACCSLLVHDGDDLVAVGCHARWQDIDGKPSRLWIVGAVALSSQGERLSNGQRASDALVEILLNDVVERDDPPPE